MVKKLSSLFFFIHPQDLLGVPYQYKWESSSRVNNILTFYQYQQLTTNYLPYLPYHGEMKLCGWTPKTEHLLHLHDDRKSSGGGVVGYDVIDHAFEAQFPEHLLHELHANGWIGNKDNKDGYGDNDNNDRLSPARTALDVNIQSLLGGFLDSNSNDNSSSNIRGDESAFISREERSQSNFHIQYPYLHRLVSSIENTVTNKKVDTEQETIFEFDTSLTSVQLARYNGDAKSGYPRHCDQGMTCAKEYSINHSDSNSNNNADSSTVDKKVENDGRMQRLLTFVYYLTPNDWDAKLDGGCTSYVQSIIIIST